MITDPIANLLTRIRNAQQARQTETIAPHSKAKVAVLKVLKDTGFIVDFKDTVIKDNKKGILITIDQERHPITLKRVSRPGQRIYKKASDLRAIKSNLGIEILSTSSGVITNREAKKKNLGGEVICQVY